MKLKKCGPRFSETETLLTESGKTDSFNRWGLSQHVGILFYFARGLNMQFLYKDMSKYQTTVNLVFVKMVILRDMFSIMYHYSEVPSYNLKSILAQEIMVFLKSNISIK